MNNFQDAYTKYMEIQKVVALNLAKARGEMSRQKLAELSGVTYQTIYDIEEERRKPSLEVIQSLSSALRIDPSELLKNSEPVLYKPKVSDVLKRLASIPDAVYDLANELELDHEAWEDIIETLEIAVEDRRLNKKG